MTIRIGRAFDIPIEIHASWIIVFALLTYGIGVGFVGQVHEHLSLLESLGIGALTTLVFFGCLLAHEFSHALCAMRCGIGVSGITLFLFGGVAQLTREPRKWTQELAVALVGPAASLACAIVFAVACSYFESGSILGTVSFYLAISNALMAVINLLPGFPLDGGRALRAILWHVLSNRMLATRVATLLGQVIGWSAAAFGAWTFMSKGDGNGVWLFLIGWFVSDAAARSWEQEVVQNSLEGSAAADLITSHPCVLAPDDPLSRAFDAKSCAEHTDIWPVTDDRGLVGILIGSRANSVPSGERSKRRVSDLMQPVDNRLIAPADEDAREVVQRLCDLPDANGLLVADGPNVLGVVDRRQVPALIQARLNKA